MASRVSVREEPPWAALERQVLGLGVGQSGSVMLKEGAAEPADRGPAVQGEEGTQCTRQTGANPRDISIPL